MECWNEFLHIKFSKELTVLIVSMIREQEENESIFLTLHMLMMLIMFLMLHMLMQYNKN